MKFAIACLVIVSAAAFGLLRMNSAADRAEISVASAKSLVADTPDIVSKEATSVFQKAFWRRPGDDDRILHAERREWVDEQGVQKWQWFIVVDASAELLKRLRDDNVFDLYQVDLPRAIPRPPDWFKVPAEGFQCMASIPRHFFLILSRTGRRVYATDSGGGFHPGAGEPAEDSGAFSIPSPEASGRLPNSGPPRPIPPSP